MAAARPDPGINDTAEVLEMDLRHLPAPEPTVRILDALASLGDGQASLALERSPAASLPLALAAAHGLTGLELLGLWHRARRFAVAAPTSGLPLAGGPRGAL